MHRFDSAMRHVSFFYKISALSVISGLTVLNNYFCGEIEYSHQRICLSNGQTLYLMHDSKFDQQSVLTSQVIKRALCRQSRSASTTLRYRFMSNIVRK